MSKVAAIIGFGTTATPSAAGDATIALFGQQENGGCIHPWRVAGAFSGLFCNVGFTSGNNTCTLHFQKNGINGNQSISFVSGALGQFQDTTNVDSVAAGNTILAHLTVAVGGSTVTLSACGVAFVRDDFESSGLLTQTLSSTLNTFPQGEFVSPTSNQALTEANARVPMVAAAQVSNLQVNVGSASDVVTGIAFRSNASSVLAVSIPALASGLVEDTSTSSLLLNDLVCFGKTGAATSQLGLMSATVQLSGANMVFINAAGGTQTLYGLGGGVGTTVHCPLIGAQTLSALKCKGSNTGSTSHLVALRKNGVNTSLRISIAAGASGTFTNVTDTVAVLGTDQIDYASSAFITLSWVMSSSDGNAPAAVASGFSGLTY